MVQTQQPNMNNTNVYEQANSGNLYAPLADNIIRKCRGKIKKKIKKKIILL